MRPEISCRTVFIVDSTGLCQKEKEKEKKIIYILDKFIAFIFRFEIPGKYVKGKIIHVLNQAPQSKDAWGS
jgi:hypothetical protein